MTAKPYLKYCIQFLLFGLERYTDKLSLILSGFLEFTYLDWFTDTNISKNNLKVVNNVYMKLSHFIHFEYHIPYQDAQLIFELYLINNIYHISKDVFWKQRHNLCLLLFNWPENCGRGHMPPLFVIIFQAISY